MHDKYNKACGTVMIKEPLWEFTGYQVHLTNVEQRQMAADPQREPAALSCESATATAVTVYTHCHHFIIITNHQQSAANVILERSSLLLGLSMLGLKQHLAVCERKRVHHRRRIAQLQQCLAQRVHIGRRHFLIKCQLHQLTSHTHTYAHTQLQLVISDTDGHTDNIECWQQQHLHIHNHFTH